MAISKKSGKVYFSDAGKIAPIQIGKLWDGLEASVISIVSNDPVGR